jgi:hypothetical protein
MFVVQPPCKTVVVNIENRGHRAKCEYRRGAGVTLGGLYDFIQLKIKRYKFYQCVWISVPGYALMDEDGQIFWRRFTSVCNVVAGAVCRPTNLPLQIASSDTDSSRGSDDDHWAGGSGGPWDDYDENGDYW